MTAMSAAPVSAAAMPLRAIVGERRTVHEAVWPAIDASILRRSRRDPVPLPLQLLGPWGDWVASTAEGAGVPADYVAAPLLASIAALVGNARKVRAWDGWDEPFVLWTGVVGDPSSGKSPGSEPVIQAIRDIEREGVEDFEARHRSWAAEAEAAKARGEKWKGEVQAATNAGRDPPQKPANAIEPKEPALPRIVSMDSTPEEIARLVSRNPRGLLNSRDELAGWLSSFARYNGDSRAFWLEAFGARSYVVDRVKADSLLIPRLAVSVSGGIQPDRLSEVLLKGVDDGLSSRFIWFWPEPIPPRRPRQGGSPQLIRDAFRRLRALHPKEDESGQPIPLTIPLTPAAADALDGWRTDHWQSTKAHSGFVASAWGKMPGTVLRLAGVLQLGAWAIEGGDEPAAIDREHLLAAVAFVETYLKPMTSRVYGDASLPVEERNAVTLARWICACGVAVVNVRAVKRDARLPGLRDEAAIEAAIKVLIEAGWLVADHSSTGGRPRKDYTVNPAVRELYHEA